MTSGESHYYQGRRYLLHVVEKGHASKVEIDGRKLRLFVPPGSDRDHRAKTLTSYYRTEIKDRIGPLEADWSQQVGVEPPRWQIRRMKTRWGSCNPVTRRLLFNL